MPIVGFNYNKIDVEKTDKVVAKMNVKSDVQIKSIKEEKLPTGKTKTDGLRFDFIYNIAYEPKIGKVNLSGFVYYLDDPKILKDILKGWKKDKSIPDAVTLEIINAVLFRSTIKALAFSQEVNLPPHLPVIPKANTKVNSKNYIG